MHGVLPFVSGENFVGEVAEHLVDVHVHARVAAALPHIERKLFFKAAGDHTVAGFGNSARFFRRESTNLGGSQCTGFLNLAERFVHVRVGDHGKACGA